MADAFSSASAASMDALVQALFERLGATYLETDDAPLLLVDEELPCYFLAHGDGRRIICPFGPLRRDPVLLEDLLCANYADDNRVVLAASRPADCLLAYVDVWPDQGPDGLEDAFSDLVAQARAWRRALVDGGEV